MIWAIKNSEKIKAQPKQKALCPICNEELIAKCGKIKIWHWAHKSGTDCDDWYEPESAWHLNWKNLFPKKQQEVIIKKCVSEYCYSNKLGTAPIHGAGHFPCNHKNCADCVFKKHIADIKTKTGLVIELQHSPISSENIKIREEFYDNMIWVLDGKTFGKNIYPKTKLALCKWIPSIIRFAKKPIFIDFGTFIIKKNFIYEKGEKNPFGYYPFKKTYLNFQKYSKKQFLHLYGDIYDKFSESTKIKNGGII